MKETIADFFAAYVIGSLAWFFGGLDGFVKVLIAFSVTDYLSGVAVAWTRHEICSRIGFRGILRKCVMFSLVGVANLIDTTFLGNTDAVRTAVVLFYVGNEGISIMENAYTLGVPFPKVLREHFMQFSKGESIDTPAQKGGVHDGGSNDNIRNDGDAGFCERQ